MKKNRLSDPFRFDRDLLHETGDIVRGTDLLLAGADEAGRGCLAGPLVAAAVVLDYSAAPFAGLERLTDSKLLRPETRESLYGVVLRSAVRVAWVACSPCTIDRVGLHRCNIDALGRSLEALGGEYRLAVVDGFDLKRPELRARAIIAADYKSGAVAAASILAKVVRDRLMRMLAPLHPEYGFEEHVGYGTERHRAALRRHGPCEFHRLSFQGVGTSQLGLWDE
ncbi:MAG: ribonuclease HII [Thermoleophilia bacterium]|nr:ribonuclease HII [Thermoleophilia bacterium]